MIALLVLRPMVPRGLRGGSPSGDFTISNFKRPPMRHYSFIFVGSMPNLPKRLALVRAAVASSLRLSLHATSLYSGDDIATALSITADVKGGGARSVDATLLKCAFTSKGANDFDLAYNDVLGRAGDTDILYVRKTPKHVRKAGGSNFCLAIGWFASMDAAKCSNVVRWNYGMDEDVRAGLVKLLTKSKDAKKRKVSEVFSVDGAGVSSRTPQPLVKISGTPSLAGSLSAART